MVQLRVEGSRVVNTLAPAVEAWQVGSVVPPSTCLCCGRRFTPRRRARMGPFESGPYKYVCKPCWARPHLFFEDKMLATCGECWVPFGAPCKSRHNLAKLRRRHGETLVVTAPPLPKRWPGTPSRTRRAGPPMRVTPSSIKRARARRQKAKRPG